MGDIYDTTTREWTLDGRHLVRQQDFWYVMGMTTWIVLPWICTREVPVDIELVNSLSTNSVTANANALSRHSRRPRWLSCASGVGCSKDCSAALVAAP